MILLILLQNNGDFPLCKNDYPMPGRGNSTRKLYSQIGEYTLRAKVSKSAMAMEASELSKTINEFLYENQIQDPKMARAAMLDFFGEAGLSDDIQNVFDGNLQNEECEYLKIIFISSDADVHAVTTYKLCKKLQARGMSNISTELVKTFFNALTASRKIEIVRASATNHKPTHSNIAPTQEMPSNKGIEAATHSSKYKPEVPKEESRSMTLDEAYKQLVELDFRKKYKKEIDYWTLVAYTRKTESQKKNI